MAAQTPTRQTRRRAYARPGAVRPSDPPGADGIRDRLECADRRLLVLEQLFRVAGVDPDGRPFTISEAGAFFQEPAVLIAEVRQELRHGLVSPPARDSNESVAVTPPT
jgi:hypothetical protein